MSHSASDGRSMLTVAHDLLTNLFLESNQVASSTNQEPLYDILRLLPRDEILRLGPAVAPYDPKKVLPQPPYEVRIVYEGHVKEEIEYDENDMRRTLHHAEFAASWKNTVECHSFSVADTEKILRITKEEKISMQVSTNALNFFFVSNVMLI